MLLTSIALSGRKYHLRSPSGDIGDVIENTRFIYKITWNFDLNWYLTISIVPLNHIIIHK